MKLLSAILLLFSYAVSAQVDSSVFAIFPYDTTLIWTFKSGEPTSLDASELKAIDQLLVECIADYNLNEVPKRKNIFGAAPIELEDYKRQYVPIINEQGEKEVSINCFCSALDVDWRKEQVIVLDGGDCFFNLKVNLTQMKYYDLHINGPG